MRWAGPAGSLLGAALAIACGATGGGGPFGSGNEGGGQTGGAGAANTNGGGPDGGTTTLGGGAPTDPCEDVKCDPGTVCDNGNCVPGCSDEEPCAQGLSCCNDACVDLANDVNHCGSCPKQCPKPEHQAMTCSAGVCTPGACDDGFFDCDGDGATGCESDVQCACTPGEVQPCYPGPAGTEGQGICIAGTRKCNTTGTAFGLCYGYVTPMPEVCANSVDEDCNGIADDVPDIDGDGWTACDNDCCEITQDCASPVKVNPGAFEFIGNSVDDDCDPATSDAVAPAPCSTQQQFDNTTATVLAQAMELCQQTTANEPLPTRKWGLVKAELVNADGTAANASALAAMEGIQSAVMTAYGTGGVVPQKGPTMAGISSGRMRDANDPGYGAPNGGMSHGRHHNPPAVYLAAHGGQLPASFSCNGSCPSGSGANDSVNLRLTIRVPTNALSFSYQFRFFSAEYWTYSCTSFNDFYLALLTTKANGIPADHNISFDSKNNPVSVNNGFFDVCVKKGCYSCPLGTQALQGTGMEIGNTGGATAWLKTTAPIVPGETMVLELMVFDVSDGILDSLSLLDAFDWSIDASAVGTGPPG